MSTNTNIFSKIWAHIVSVAMWISGIFKGLPDWVKKVAPIVNKTLDNIREIAQEADKWINSPTSDLITRIIPGGLDDTILAFLKKALPFAISKLVDVDDCEGDLGCMVKKFIMWLQPQKPAVQEAAIQKASAVVLKQYDAGRLQDNQYDFFAQAAYSGMKRVPKESEITG